MEGCIIEANIAGQGQGWLPISWDVGVEILKKVHHKKGVLKQKSDASLYTLYWDFKIIPFTVYTYVLAEISQNGAKLIQKTESWFKKSQRNLDNFRQAVESPKSWNLMGYFCPKNTFLQLKHMQWIYPTLISTSSVKIHQMTFFFLIRTNSM